MKKGWNEWTGEGVSSKNFESKVDRAEQIRKQKIEEIKKLRFDSKLRGVVVNSEQRDKKFAQKYLVKELPHPYNSVEQYQKAMSQSIGKEWNT